jgi:amidase
MLDATAGPETGALHHLFNPDTTFLSQVDKDPGKLRIAFVKDSYLGTTVEKDCLEGFEATVKLCHELGHDIEEMKIPVDGKTLARAFLTIICGEIMAFIEDSREIVGKDVSYRYFEPVTWATALLGSQFKASEYTAALNLIQRTGRYICDYFTKFDVLLTPTLTRLPLMTGTLQLRGIQAIALKLLGRLNAGGVIRMFVNIDELAERFFSFIQYLPVFNVTGQPAMSVPLYWNNEGLPVGMQFVGQHGDEATLYRLAGQLEKARPWADRIPPVCNDV